MKRLSMLAAGLLIGATALQFSNVASGQSDGWVTLVDGTKRWATGPRWAKPIGR
jgi:hypothetical protein